MLRKIVAIMMLLAFPLAVPAAEPPDAPSETKRLDEVKTDAEHLRLSAKKAAVVMTDNSKISGHIAEVTNDGFTLTVKNGQRKQFSFADVRTIKKSGLGTGAKVAIGIGIGVAAWAGIGCAIGACSD